MKLVWVTTIIIILLSLVIPGVLAMGIRKIPGGYQPLLYDSQQINPNITVSQSFTASQSGLSGIALTIRNPYQINKNDIYMSLLQNGKVLRNIKLNGANIPDGGFMNFNFNPIPESKGQLYQAVFYSPEVKTQPLELYHSNKPFDGVYQVNGKRLEGSLSFITYYAPKNIFAVWGMIYGSWFSRFFGDLPFMLFYFILIIAMGIYLIKTHIFKAG